MVRLLITGMFLFFLLDVSSGQVPSLTSAGRLDEALDSCEKAYEEASRQKDPVAIFFSLTGIFDVYRQKGDYDKSFFYARKLYGVAEQVNDSSWLFIADWCLAEVYSQEGDFQDALDYYRRASFLPRRMTKGVDRDAFFQLEWAEAYSQVDQFDSAWKVYGQYKLSYDTTRPVYLVSTGECLYLNGRFNQALRNFQAAIEGYDRAQGARGIMRASLDIGRTCLAIGNARTALQFARRVLSLAVAGKANPYIRDSYHLISEAYAKMRSPDSSNYYFAKYALVKEGILNDIVKAKFAAYRYDEKITAIDRENQIQAIQLQKESFEKKIFLAGCIGLAFIACGIIIIARLNRRNEQRKRQVAETELELKALRARMDPHFIFNCLNSINTFIIRNDTRNAADYLTKFAKLMRMVLESSAQSYIPLSEELAMLKAYLTLENLRFEQPFAWGINCNLADAGAILVPTLLIQPFVENAIWHGVHPRQDGGGEITITLRQSSQLLYCEILDNGIGRKAAAKRQGEGRTQRPMGIDLTIQRLERIHPKGADAIGVTIEDLSTNTGENAGTRVLLTIPIKAA